MRRRSLPVRDDGPPGFVAAGAALFASAEVASGFALGFFALGRAETLLFLAVRPGLLLVAALLIAARPWKSRLTLLGWGLVTATLAEEGLIVAIGGEVFRFAAFGLLASVLAVLAIDVAIAAGTRVAGRAGRIVASLFVALLIASGALSKPFERIALFDAAKAEPDRRRPGVLLVSALPLLFGETGPLDPAGRPNAAIARIEREFALRPLDHLSGLGAAPERLLLLAQPRVLEPSELAALDRWVSGGGSALILADPDLVWPSLLPLGYPGRPPSRSLLAPLLDYWGLQLESSSESGPVMIDRHRLLLARAGCFTRRSSRCRAESHFATCHIGRGRAFLVADADFLRDETWMGRGSAGGERNHRLGDTPVFLADRLDALAGIVRLRRDGRVNWRQPGPAPWAALFTVLVPILVSLAIAIRRRRKSTHGLIPKTNEGTKTVQKGERTR